MGVIKESPNWEQNIYMVQETDPVLGGEDGTINIQPKQLANRTAYLKALLAVKHLADGGHEIANDQVSLLAGIVEPKLHLDFSTEALYAKAQEGLLRLGALNSDIDNIIGIDGTDIGAIGKAVPLSWLYSEYGFDFELFASTLILRDLPKMDLTGTVQGDESVDCSDTSKLELGEYYVVCDADGNHPEVIKISEILTKERIRAVDELGHTRTEGRIGHTSWDIFAGYAEAKQDGVFISKTMEVLKLYNQGKVIIRRDTSAAYLTLKWKKQGSDLWEECTYLRTVLRENGYKDDEFLVPGDIGKLMVTVKNVPSGEVLTIDHMVCFPYGNVRLTEEIQRPYNFAPMDRATGILVGVVLEGSDYRSLYGETQLGAQFQVSRDLAFSDIIFDDTVAGAVTTLALNTIEFEEATNYFWRVRYMDDVGNVSTWSEPTQFTTNDVFESIRRPTNLTPTEGTIVSSYDAKFVSSNFHMEVGTSVHTKSQWVIASDTAFTKIVYDSGEVSDSKTTLALPPNLNFEHDQIYYWRVRHFAENPVSGYKSRSDWSTATSFTINKLTYVEDVFSAEEYSSSGGAIEVETSIDLPGKGGALWVKDRTVSSNHFIIDAIRNSFSKSLACNTTDSEVAASRFAVTSKGFTDSTPTTNNIFSAYSFRESKRFFDVVEYAGDGVSTRKINHDLECIPGMIIVKCTSHGSTNWVVWHRSLNGGYLKWNTNELTNFGTIHIENVTASSFNITNTAEANASGRAYVAYVFAHDMSAEGIIKCGSFEGNSADYNQTYTGSGNVTLPVGVSSIKVTGKGGTGTYTAQQGLAAYPSGLPTYHPGQSYIAPTGNSAYPSGLPAYQAAYTVPAVGNSAYPNGLPKYQAAVAQQGLPAYPNGLPKYLKANFWSFKSSRYYDGNGNCYDIIDQIPNVLPVGKNPSTADFPIPYDGATLITNTWYQPSGGAYCQITENTWTGRQYTEGNASYPNGLPAYVPAQAGQGNSAYPNGLPAYVPAQPAQGNSAYPNGLPAYQAAYTVPAVGSSAYPNGLPPYDPGRPYIAPSGNSSYPNGLPVYKPEVYTTGANTIVTVDGQSEVFAGGYGGAATASTKTMAVNDAIAKTLNYNCGSGGSVQLVYTKVNSAQYDNTFSGPDTLTIPADVPTVTITGKGGAGSTKTSTGEGNPAYPDGLPPYSKTVLTSYSWKLINSYESQSANLVDVPGAVYTDLAVPPVNAVAGATYEATCIIDSGISGSTRYTYKTKYWEAALDAPVIVGKPEYPDGLPAYSAPGTNYTTGQATTVTVNGQTYTFSGGYGGAASATTQTVSLPGNAQSTVICNTAPGGSVRVQYSRKGSNTVMLDWEPQFVMIKAKNLAGDWMIFDSISGITNGTTKTDIFTRTNSAAANASGNYIDLVPKGFVPIHSTFLDGNNEFIYMAIRRAPVQKAVDPNFSIFSATRTGNGAAKSEVITGFPPDLVLSATQTSLTLFDKVRGAYSLSPYTNAAEVAQTNAVVGMKGHGFYVGSDPNQVINKSGTSYWNIALRRHKNVFSTTQYTGVAGVTTYDHILESTPELLIVKRLDAASNWAVAAYCTGAPNEAGLINSSAAFTGTKPGVNAQTFGVNFAGTTMDVNNGQYIAYMFATRQNISKVGTYVGTGTVMAVFCDFSSEARIVLIKRTDAVGDWYLWNAEDGSMYYLNKAGNAAGANPYLETIPTGFRLTEHATAALNAAGGKYLYLALA